MFIIGLTGGIASGKTTVANEFAKLGVPVINADNISRELVEPGTPALQNIVNHFGNNILDINNDLDRNKLRKIIIQDNKQKIWLEHLLHPLIAEVISDKIKLLNNSHPSPPTAGTSSPSIGRGIRYCIIEVPLLAESQHNIHVDRILVVDINETLQIARAKNRGQEDIQELVKLQASRENRLKIADDIIDNNGDLQELQKQVVALHKKYLGLKC